MPGEDDPRHIRRSDRRPEIGLGARVVPYEHGFDIESPQIIANIGDELAIGIAARRIESYERAENREASHVFAHDSNRDYGAEPPPAGRNGGGVINMSVIALGRLPRGLTRVGVPSTNGMG